VAMRAFPELRHLLELRESGRWVFQAVLVEGSLDVIAGGRLWPNGWSDAIAIRNVGDAQAFRCDPAGGQVWHREGGLVEVLDGLRDLPAPDQPGAPRLVTATAPQPRLPPPANKLDIS